ncbi:hypothetical protein NQ318_008977 [Aromia moschata]|uniref:Uncharacterized protein n=1 Tax=Aromia moschata TaxID=1265417 RepID=A0AAV8ZAL2_9CUCU|nr:hypothetical protein NQ318_008977 [Aromia moschata]
MKQESASKLIIGKIVVLLFGINIGFVVDHLIATIRDGIRVDISEDISHIIGGSVAAAAVAVFMYLGRSWTKLLSDVAYFGTFGRHANFDELKRKLNKSSVAVFSAYFLAAIIYSLTVYAERAECERVNHEKGLHEFCGSLTSLRLPFDGSSLAIRLPIFLAQVFICAPMMVAAGHLTFLIFEVTEFFVLHCENLKKYLREVFDTAESRDCLERLTFCISYHNHILRMIGKFNVLVKYTAGDFSLTAAIIIGCVGNQTIKVIQVEVIDC